MGDPQDQAEKAREVIADQFEARRTKNKATRERKIARREERLAAGAAMDAPPRVSAFGLRGGKVVILIGKKDLRLKLFTPALVRSPRRRRPSRHHGLELGVIHLPGPVRVRLPNQLVDVDSEPEILRGRAAA